MISATPAPPPGPGEAPRRPPLTGVKPASPPREQKAKKTVDLATAKEIETWFKKLYGTVGAFLLPFKPNVANIILINAEKCAAANAKLAMEDVRVRRAISAAMVTGIWSAVIIAHLPILLALASEAAPSDPEKRLNSDMLFGLALQLSGAEVVDDESEADNGTGPLA